MTHALLIGTDQEGSTGLTVDYIIANQFEALGSGLVHDIEVYSTVAGNCKAAIYDDNSGDPNNRLAVNNSGHACLSGQWNRIKLDKTIRLVKGTDYWLTTITDTAGAAVREGTPDIPYKYRSDSYSSGLPDPAGSGYTLLQATVSIRIIDKGERILLASIGL